MHMQMHMDAQMRMSMDVHMRMRMHVYMRMYMHKQVRHAYQRPLEQWLLLDQCMYLEEQGYAVQLRQFCETSVSPRNLLVLGERLS